MIQINTNDVQSKSEHEHLASRLLNINLMLQNNHISVFITDRMRNSK